MRIISSFKDYYDCIQAYHSDDVIYVREPKTIQVDLKFPSIDSHYGIRGATLRYHSHLIGFCGRLYPVVYFHGDGSEYWCYTIEDIDKVVDERLKKKERESYYTPKQGYWRRWFTARGSFIKYFKSIKEETRHLPDFFQEYKTPVFSLYDDGRRVRRVQMLNINCSLKMFEFYRVIDAYTAGQEVYMFMSNMAMPNKPIPHVPDKIMVEAKGFDKITSFRKPKQK